jgi:integrase
VSVTGGDAEFVVGPFVAETNEFDARLPSPIGRDYLLLVLFTGLRRREAAGLRWRDVDLASRTLRIPAERNKAGRKLDLPLTDFVHDLLARRRTIGRTEFIFPAASRSGHLEMPRYFLEQVATASGVKVTVHDLRRSFITVAESCDISPIALKALTRRVPTSPLAMSRLSSSGCAGRRNG